MRLILHERAFTEAGAALRSVRHVLVCAQTGLGRTRLASNVTAEHAEASGRRVVRMTVPRDPSPDTMLRLLPADLRPAERAADDVADALAAWLAGTVLVVDDAHRLRPEDERVLDRLARRPGDAVQLVMTVGDVPGSVPLLRRLRRDDVVVAVRLELLTRQEAEVFVQDLIEPERFDGETLKVIYLACGGVPLLLDEYTRTLRRAHANATSSGIVFWDRTPVRRGDMVELGDHLTSELSPDALQAARAVALVGPVSPTVVAAFAGGDALEELALSGLVESTGTGVHERLAVSRSFARLAVRSTMSHRERAAMAAPLLQALDLERRPASGWRPDELQSLAAYAHDCGLTLSLDFTRRAWASVRGSGDYALVANLATALIDHPEAVVDDRLRAFIDRIDTGRALALGDQARADVASAMPLLATASARARAEFLCAQARFLHHVDQDHAGAQRLLSDAITDVDRLRSTDASWAWATMFAERASLLSFSGQLAEAHDALASLLSSPRTSAHNLPAVAGYVMIASQRGDSRQARTVAGRYFPLALAKARAYPWVPAEMVVAGFFQDIVSGRVAAAERIMRRVTHAIMRGGPDLPPYDPAASHVGFAMVHAAAGDWLLAAEEYEVSLSEDALSDTNGIRGFVLSQYAVALAASGAVDHAVEVVIECREGLTGLSRIAEPFASVQLLLAQLWLGQDVADEALALAHECTAQDLPLMELRALHLAALDLGGRTPHALVERARHLADAVTAPIAAPLAQHVEELAAGVPRLAGVGARLLARHGLVVPSRIVRHELTQRERQVAAAAALGFSSKSIAAQLGNSKRTIDAHLNRIYVKLGVTGRDDLADALDVAAL